MDPLLLDILPWVRQGSCCSQLLIRLMLQASGEDNPALVRSVWGFCEGMAGGGCGLLLGGVAALSYTVGSGAENGPHPMAVPLINDFTEWFRSQPACARGTDCLDVSAVLQGVERVDAPNRERCGDLLAASWGRIMELLAEYEIDPAGERL